MASRELILNISQESGRRVASFDSAQLAQPARFFLGDTVPIKARILAAGSGGALYQDADLTDQVIRVAIGSPSAQPSTGSFRVSYGADQTAALAHNASAATLESALNALTSITAAGGVAVTKSTSGPYRIVFTTTGAKTSLTVDSTLLYPTTSTEVVVAVEGDVSNREIVLIRLETQPAAYAQLDDPLQDAGATIATIRAGAAGVAEIQTMRLDPEPHAGTYAIGFDGELTGALPWNATAAEIAAALESLTGIGAGQISVSGDFPSYTLTFAAALEDVEQITVDVSGLIVPTGRMGELDLNVVGIMELLDGSASKSASLEVEIYDTSAFTAWTVIQEPCTVLDDVSGGSPSYSPPLPSCITTSTPGSVIAAMLGLTSYADLTAANAALAPGIPYFDETLDRINNTTA